MRSFTASRSFASDSMPSCLANASSICELAGRVDRLRGDLEGRFLAGKVGLQIVRRERRLDGAVLARLDADKLLLEARDERLRADHHRDVVARAALERRAVDRAGEGDRDLVAGGRFRAFALGQERTVLLGDAA